MSNITINSPSSIGAPVSSGEPFEGCTLSFPMLMALLMKKGLEANDRTQANNADEIKLAVQDLQKVMSEWQSAIDELKGAIGDAKASAKTANFKMSLLMGGCALAMSVAPGIGAMCTASAVAAAMIAGVICAAVIVGTACAVYFTDKFDSTDNTKEKGGKVAVCQSKAGTQQGEISRITTNNITPEENDKQNKTQLFQNFIDLLRSIYTIHAA